MNIEVNENREIILKEVYLNVTLITDDKESLSICMRDSGFEFVYEGKKYSAQNGVINDLEQLKEEQLKEEQEQLIKKHPNDADLGRAVRLNQNKGDGK